MTIAQFWPLFPFGFAALWVLVCSVISLCGWRPLARHYAASSKPVGHVFSLQSAEIGGAQYNGCLSLVAAPSGLWLRPIFLFGAFHPPLLLPWSAFGMPREKKVLWSRQWRVEVQTPDGKTVELFFSPAVGVIIAEHVAAAKAAPDVSPWSDRNAME